MRSLNNIVDLARALNAGEGKKPLCLCWYDSSCLGKDGDCLHGSAVKVGFTAVAASTLEVLEVVF